MTTSRTVLVVEDEPDIRDCLELILNFEGYSVLTAPDGRAGLKRLAEAPPFCVVLLDLMMPVMNGWEFLAAMKADPVRAASPVILVTAYAERSENLAVDAIEKKPIEIERLLARIESCFNRKGDAEFPPSTH
jgi:CheY-like chemotaxis protein